jgi:hypothetical protein
MGHGLGRLKYLFLYPIASFNQGLALIPDPVDISTALIAGTGSIHYVEIMLLNEPSLLLSSAAGLQRPLWPDDRRHKDHLQVNWLLGTSHE